jgi:hypothetical protein
MRLRIINLFSTGVVLHKGNACCAAWTAASTSFSLESGTWQKISPVAGFILSRNFPLSGAMRFPPI